MKRVIFLVLLFGSLASTINAQIWKMRRWEVSGAIGTTKFFGDIGGLPSGINGPGFKDIIINHARFSGSLGMRYRFYDNFSARFGLSMGLIYATDDDGSYEDRGLEATTALFEPVVTAEYFLVKNSTKDIYSFLKRRRVFESVFSKLDVYAYAGVAPLIYRVSANEKLASIMEKDGGVTLAFPAGLGVNYVVSPNVLLGIDIGLRYTTTDYLDGYASQYSNSNDVYYFMTFVFTHKLKTSEKGLPSFRK